MGTTRVVIVVVASILVAVGTANVIRTELRLAGTSPLRRIVEVGLPVVALAVLVVAVWAAA